ncbi:hypothetical protein D3C71_1667350 [compost metagenome]
MSIRLSAIGPLSMAVTSMPRLTSCQVHPPGAAPKSTPVMSPCRRSSHWSRGMKWCQASSSLRVERLGASRGNFKRGMPIGHIAELFDSARPMNTSRPLLNVSSKRGLWASSTSLPAAISALRRCTSNFLQKFDSSLPSLVSTISSHRLPHSGKSAI